MTVNIYPAFIKQICQHLADNSEGRFTFGSGESNNLKLGELKPGIQGVYCVQGISIAPSVESFVDEYVIDFWSVNANSATAYDDLMFIYQLFHSNINITLSNYQVYLGQALSQIEDMDRDSESRKIFKLSISFILKSLIS